MTEQELARAIDEALRTVDPWAEDTPNLNAWPQPAVRGEFSIWLAKRIVALSESLST